MEEEYIIATLIKLLALENKSSAKAITIVADDLRQIDDKEKIWNTADSLIYELYQKHITYQTFKDMSIFRGD